MATINGSINFAIIDNLKYLFSTILILFLTVSSAQAEETVEVFFDPLMFFDGYSTLQQVDVRKDLPVIDRNTPLFKEIEGWLGQREEGFIIEEKIAIKIIYPDETIFIDAHGGYFSTKTGEASIPFKYLAKINERFAKLLNYPKFMRDSDNGAFFDYN